MKIAITDFKIQGSYWCCLNWISKCDFLVVTLNKCILLNMTSRNHLIKELWFYGWELLAVNHGSVNFGGHNSCRSGDLTFLICHKTSHDHLIKELYDLKDGGSGLRWSHNLRVMWRCGWEPITVICQLT